MIQRFPSGLLELLAAKTSGWTPGELARDVQPTLELLQLFGQNSIVHRSVQNATAAEGDFASLVVPSTEWWLLYGIDQTYVKTATMTVFVGSLRINAFASNDWVVMAEGPKVLQAFGSTAGTGAGASCSFWPSYPMLLSPGTQLFSRCDILGTDATVNLYLNARYAVLT